jgi:hypothetical protein
MELNDLFAKLWTQYVEESPLSLKIHNLFVERGENVINDHVAFRTFDDSRVNVEALAKFFKVLGYEERGEYHFTVKKLYAKHYEHKTDPLQPKIFISELKTTEFSPYLQQQVKAYVDLIPTQALNSIDLLYAGNLIGELDYDIYQKLLAESEYAAWMYVFGFRANHFTVLVNQLKTLTTVEEVNTFLKSQNIALNTSGGEIKGNRKECLEQSSTIANKVMVRFKQGEFPVLNSYYEFAKRYPMENGKLYQGFVAASADKIFESTDIKNT